MDFKLGFDNRKKTYFQPPQTDPQLSPEAEQSDTHTEINTKKLGFFYKLEIIISDVNYSV